MHASAITQTSREEEMSSTSADLFLDSVLPDPLSPFADCGLDFDLLQEFTECLHQDSPNPVQGSAFIDPIAHEYDPALLPPSSPPPFPHFPVASSDECQSSASLYKDMQRSFSSISFDGIGNLAKFNGVTTTESGSGLINHVNPPTALSSPEVSGQMIRRACSTGDLVEESSTSHFRGGPGRYTAEERRERIHRYRAKRNQRNFTKTIKYACRKTLADNRPRVRGRFARHDEPSSSSSDQIDNFGDSQGNVRGGHASF